MPSLAEIYNFREECLTKEEFKKHAFEKFKVFRKINHDYEIMYSSKF